MTHKGTEFLIVALSKPSIKTSRAVAEKASSRVCLGMVRVDGKDVPCESESKQRGLCMKCYSRWYREMARMTPEKRIEFEAKMIRLGRLLGDQQIRDFRDDYFKRMAR